jgi:hypothetical protein
MPSQPSSPSDAATVKRALDLVLISVVALTFVAVAGMGILGIVVCTILLVVAVKLGFVSAPGFSKNHPVAVNVAVWLGCGAAAIALVLKMFVFSAPEDVKDRPASAENPLPVQLPIASPSIPPPEAPAPPAEDAPKESATTEIRRPKGPAPKRGGALPVINELFFNSKGADVGCFIELKGTPGASLNGFTLRAVNGAGGTTIDEVKFNATHVFDANGFFVVVQDTTVVLPAGAASIVNALADLQNGPDNLVLVDPTDVTVDAIGYSDVTGKFNPPNVFAGEGVFAVAPNEAQLDLNSTLSRQPDGNDTNNNAVDFGVGPRTPGAPN